MIRILLVIFTLFCNSICYALPFSIVPKTGTQLPSIVYSGNTATAYYTVTNNTKLQRNANFVKYLPLNVSMVTSGGTYSDTCGSTFNLSSHGLSGDSCTLQLTISGAVDRNNHDIKKNILICFPGGVTCADTLYPLNVALVENTLQSIAISPTHAVILKTATQQYSAVGIYADGTSVNLSNSLSWSSSNTSIATISSLGLATGVSAGTASLSGQFNNVTSNSALLSIIGFAFVANSLNDTVSSCTVNSDASLSSCSTTGTGFNHPSGIAVNFAGTYIYVTNTGNNTVSYCAIDRSTGALSSCATTGSGFNAPAGIVLTSTGTRAYIVNNGDGSIISCTVNSNGTLSSCTTAATGFTAPNFITLNPAETFLYFTDVNYIKYCAIQRDGSLTSCGQASSNFSLWNAIAINSQGTVAYLTSATNDIDVCDVHSDGTLSNACNGVAGGALIDPYGIALTDNYAFISNYLSSSVLSCPLNNEGMIILGDCLSTSSGFNGPRGVALS